MGATNMVNFSAGDGSSVYEEIVPVNKPGQMWIDEISDSDEAYLFIVEQNEHRVRVVNLTTGEINTFAGDGEDAFDGDGGEAKTAAVGSPFGIVGNKDFIYISQPKIKAALDVSRPDNDLLSYLKGFYIKKPGHWGKILPS